uniref:NP3 n=1 Tax=Hapalochlaena maculosa TaxID=61716 RepID=B6Z1Z2_HAPMA|nr:NP3 [Hapalochlaena maculosa]
MKLVILILLLLIQQLPMIIHLLNTNTHYQLKHSSQNNIKIHKQTLLICRQRFVLFLISDGSEKKIIC